MDPADRIVVAQAASLAGLAWPGSGRWTLPSPVRLLALTLTGAGGAFSVLAARPHGRRLTPRVAPPSEAELLHTGPYAISRHPIYAGLVVAGLGFAVLRRRLEPLLAWAALVGVLTVKTSREEVHLAARFGERYEQYRRRTPRFVGIPRS